MKPRMLMKNAALTASQKVKRVETRTMWLDVIPAGNMSLTDIVWGDATISRAGVTAKGGGGAQNLRTWVQKSVLKRTAPAGPLIPGGGGREIGTHRRTSR